MFLRPLFVIVVNEERCLNIEKNKDTFNQVRILYGNQNDICEDCIRQWKSIKGIMLGFKAGQKLFMIVTVDT